MNWMMVSDDAEECARIGRDQILKRFPAASIGDVRTTELPGGGWRVEIEFDDDPPRVLAMRWSCDRCDAAGDTWEGMREHDSACV